MEAEHQTDQYFPKPTDKHTHTHTYIHTPHHNHNVRHVMMWVCHSNSTPCPCGLHHTLKKITLVLVALDFEDGAGPQRPQSEPQLGPVLWVDVRHARARCQPAHVMQHGQKYIHTNTHIHIHTPTHPHTHTPTYTHTHIHTHTHTYIHTYTHTTTTTST
jgi:hypothetical protein